MDRKSVNGRPVESVRIFIRNENGNVIPTKPIDIDLYDENDGELWHSYPSDPSIDIAVIPLRPPVVDDPLGITTVRDDSELETYGFNIEHLPRPDEIIVGASSMVVLGYPYQVSSPYYPVARDALCASPYGQPYRDKPRFMTDARTHNGLSGSPVLTQPSPMQVSKSGRYDIGSPRKAWYLVGIHSSTLSTDIRDPLDVNEAWYSTLIPDIINSI